MDDTQFAAMYELMAKGGARTKAMRRALYLVFVKGEDVSTAAKTTAQFPSALTAQVVKARKVIKLTYTLVTGEKPCMTK